MPSSRRVQVAPILSCRFCSAVSEDPAVAVPTSTTLLGKHIQVNAIALGLTESEGVKANAGFDMARGLTVASRSIKRDMLPEDLLRTLMSLVSPDSDVETGQTINVDGSKANL